MIHAQTFDFVQWYQNPREEQFVLLFKRECKTVDDRAKNFQQLSDTVKSLCFVDKLKEYVIDRPTYIRTQIQEFPVDSMKGSFKKISFSRIL